MCLGKICMNQSTVKPVQAIVKALRAKPPRISIEENGMMIESGSARRVAVVTINATNSWRAESQPARSAFERYG